MTRSHLPTTRLELVSRGNSSSEQVVGSLVLYSTDVGKGREDNHLATQKPWGYVKHDGQATTAKFVGSNPLHGGQREGGKLSTSKGYAARTSVKVKEKENKGKTEMIFQQLHPSFNLGGFRSSPKCWKEDMGFSKM